MRPWVAIAILAVEVLAGAGALKAATTPPMPCCMSQNMLPVAWRSPCCCCLSVPGLPARSAASQDAVVHPVFTTAPKPLAAAPTRNGELAVARLNLFTDSLPPPDLILLDSALRI